MNNGILLALLAYATYSWSDAAIKALGGGLTIFEIGFFQTAIAAACIFFAKPPHERWRHFWRMSRPWAVQARAVSGLLSGVLSVLAFTTIPLADTYALVFLAPLLVTILSMVVLKEQVGPWRWFAVVAGFCGVMLVVRPGFRVLEYGHLAALTLAFLGAATMVLMRSLSNREQQTTMLGFVILYIIVFNGVMMAFTSARLPTLPETGILLIAGVFSATGHIFLLRATRFAQANQLAPTQYTQIMWAVVLGAMIFDETPDLWSIVGLAIIAASGLLTVVRERIRLGTVRWNPFYRNRI
ncbi:MAG: DMT family transporter [Rhizobiaceae bacterium]|nr:DMT family transporter [Rhizobiaceae bacterium]